MKFAMKSALVSMILLASTASAVHAAGAGSGVITFEGAIIEAACSISPESVDQTVGLGQVAKSELEAGGTGNPEPFYIKLVGCDTSTLNTVTSTFTGAESVAVPGALGIVGTASGAGIMMRDGTGAQIVLGTATTPQRLQDGDNTLSFGAYLQGSAAGTVTPGKFTAVTNFSLAYQ
ncbi:Pilin (type 1 fimbria component protein) [Pseudomonas taetrolens]|uniref:Fimbria A protein n=1 Tax=Pseudomonas taetrolens TaxID=47884 RepID=A0A0J6GM18_PSETA|nr:fimbrial protein [Pseudomonas taetrolens]KMM85751.1 fimbria A protein [Pseudomonas taetrolens]SED14331.1 Pilin (type 1 fimbria component protein) [Pseudomonas taetrolens]SQF87948.1 putative fimbrial protein [Pseudomonas taetrolens]VEH51138.1 putative fimbrial protein [Pseudomonas taetrolens]